LIFSSYPQRMSASSQADTGDFVRKCPWEKLSGSDK
jgi:hypothetical protein